MHDLNNKKTVILIRHSKTELNALGIYMGCGTDAPLSEDGRKETVKERDKIRRITGEACVFSSPMERALETAKILFGDRHINVEEALKEIDFGDFEGRSVKELTDDPGYQAWIDSGGMMTIPGGESIEEFSKRTISGLYNILRGSDSERIAIVCHGGSIMAIMSTLAGGNYFDRLVGNLEGYILTLKWDDERISDITYDRFGSGDNT